MTPPELRKHYRRLRAALPIEQQRHNAIRLARLINAHLGIIKTRRIAAYLATNGEISLNTWIAGTSRHRIYLPKLYEPIEPRLRFAALDGDTRWMKNRFNIIEPAAHWGQTLHARQLDVVLLPLVAFDRQGNRLGMGGGYYDRSVGFRRFRRNWTRPGLIGVAHGMQECTQLPVAPWDVPLDAIITEREIIIPRQRGQD